MLKTLKLSLFALALSTSWAAGHEFWIDPLDFTPAPGENLQADLRVGQNFFGSPYAFIPQNFRLFELARGDTRKPVEGRIGDRPALNMAPLGEGLNVVLHVTTDSNLTWKEWDKFTEFVRSKDAAWAIQDHLASGQPKQDFGEYFSRYGKSLMAVGDGAGADQRYGLLTEIVALDNPYTDDLSGGFSVQVFYDGLPRANTQVDVFSRDAGGNVTKSQIKTDDRGIATMAVEPGVTYLFDSVVLRRPAQAAIAKGVLWESLWASLTFRTPD